MRKAFYHIISVLFATIVPTFSEAIDFTSFRSSSEVYLEQTSVHESIRVFLFSYTNDSLKLTGSSFSLLLCSTDSKPGSREPHRLLWALDTEPQIDLSLGSSFVVISSCVDK